MTRIHSSLGLGLALLTALSLTAFNTHHESGKAYPVVSIDSKLAAEVFAGQSSKGVPLTDLLRAALTVQNDGDPVALVLHTFEIKDGRTISEFESRPFTPPTGRPWLLPSEYLPGDQFIRGFVRQTGLTTTKEAVAVDGAADHPNTLVQNELFANKPDGWERMNAFYFIVTPEKSTSKSDMTKPAAVFVMADPIEDN